jgi:two-component system OmpR family response regulator
VPSVLVVDDDRMMRILITRTLKAEGFEVRLAANAAEARLELSKAGHTVDLVLTDIVMPGAWAAISPPRSGRPIPVSRCCA